MNIGWFVQCMSSGSLTTGPVKNRSVYDAHSWQNVRPKYGDIQVSLIEPFFTLINSFPPVGLPCGCTRSEVFYGQWRTFLLLSIESITSGDSLRLVRKKSRI